MNFEDFVSQHAKGVKICVRHHYIPESDVDDVTQETLIRLWKCFDKFQDSTHEELFGWIGRAVKFEVKEYFRRLRHSRVRNRKINKCFTNMEYRPYDKLNTIFESIATPKQPLDEIIDVGNVIITIPKHEQTAIMMKIKGYKLREIAEEMGYSHVTVIDYQKQAIAKLRKRLSSYEICSSTTCS